MRIDFATLAFGYSIKTGGGTPNWATSLGQGKNYKINDNPEIDELLKGLVYSSVSLSKVTSKIGKGGKIVSGNADESPIIVASVFSKVYINDVLIPDGKYVILITRDTSKSHEGRLRIKYGPSNSYNVGTEIYSNEKFWKQVEKQLELSKDACYFTYDISVKNQDELKFRTIIVNQYSNIEYDDSTDLHRAWDKLIQLDGNSFSGMSEMENESFSELCFVTNCDNKGFSRNRILFGAPGTGKSFIINNQRKIFIGENNEEDYERVTFHPDYSYANFVGTYKPIPTIDSKGNETISYEYIPGPFMRAYVKAIKNGRTSNAKPFILIIEEINRANVAAVFGDVFQLLDRDDDQASEYPIQASEDIKKYLSKELGGEPNDYNKIRIPDNMFIWATMNSADQGVFPMDTAFKRRWDFTYLGVDDNENDLIGKTVVLGEGNTKHKVEWNKLRKAINNFLTKEKINEDKQLGPYFIARNIVVPKEGTEINNKKFIDTFKNKVIMYLFEDAAKQKRPKLFEGCFENNSRYSEICREFEKKGVGIFHHDIQLETEPEDLTSVSVVANE